MSLRAQSRLSNTTPAQGQVPSWLQQRASTLGGGKGQAGSMPQQANPQSQMLQQLMQAMMARRQSGMQNPGFMSPLQRLGTMPLMPPQAFGNPTPPTLPSQASPVAVQAIQGNTPGMQAEQAAQAAAAEKAAQAAQQLTQQSTPATPQWQYMNQVPQEYMANHGGVRDFFTWDPSKQMWRGKDGSYYQDNPSDFSYGR